MRHKMKSRRLGVKSSHRTSMLRNLTISLVEHGRIRTTVARAKSLRSFVEPLVTKLKDPSVANIRLICSIVPQRDTVLDMAKRISPVFKDRKGGYLRILRLSAPRVGDRADMALIEWVEESLVPAYSDVAPEKPAKKVAAKKTIKSKKTDSEDTASAKPAKKVVAKKAK